MSIAVVGGGVIGLAIAHYLLKLGAENVVVYEMRYVGSGSSTRNAGHFRVHFWAPENARFAVESRKMFLRLGSELGWNPLIELNGYLFLLYDEGVLRAYRRANQTWSSLGVPGKIMDVDEVGERYPYLNLEGVIGAFFGPQDGQFHHDFITFGYYSSVLKRGGRVLEYAKVDRIVVEDGRVRGVEVRGGFREHEKVVVAAGGWSNEVLRTCGVELPLVPERKEIGVTEPVARFIEPLIINTKLDGYLTQSIRGEIMGSVDYPPAPNVMKLTNTITWITRFAKMAVETIPALRHVRLMRVWSGFYVVTPDHSHVMGRDPDWPEGLYVATGFSGHGFMLAPLTGKLMAEHILYDKIHTLMEPFLPTRFKEGRLVKETMVIG